MSTFKEAHKMMFRSFAFLISCLLLLSLAYFYDQRYQQQFTQQEQAKQITQNLAIETAFINQEAEHILNGKLLLKEALHPFYRVQNNQVVEWNSFDFFPDVRLLQSSQDWRFFQSQRGQYLLFRKSIDSTSFLLSYLPLRVKFPIINRYLPDQWNKSLFQYTGIQIKGPDEEGTPIALNDRALFSISTSPELSVKPTDTIANLLLLLSLTCFVLFIVVIIRQFHQVKKFGWAFIFLVSVLIAVRVIMLWSNLPKRWTDASIFDPTVFASSSYNVSVGDLFLNTLVVVTCSSYLFFYYTRFSFVGLASRLTLTFRWILGTLFLLLCYFAFLFPFLFIETLFHNSSISLEISQSLHLDEVRSLAWISILLGTLSSFFVVHVCFKLSFLFLGAKPAEFWFALALAAAAFIGYFLFMERSYWITISICPLFLSVLYIRRKFSTHRSNSTGIILYAILTITVFSLQSALATRKFSDEKRVEAQFRFGRNFLISKDILGEYLLDQASKRIARDPLVQSRLATPFLNQAAVKTKIRQIHLSGYFDRYEVKINLFSASGKPQEGDVKSDLAEVIKSIQNTSTTTDYDGIYYISPTNEYIRKYFSIIPVDRQGNRLGFVVLELFLKKVIPHNVYPELLVDNRFSHYFSANEFSYAFYQNGSSELSFGKYNYSNFDIKNLGNAAIYTTGIESGNVLHTAIEDDYGRVVVVSSEAFPNALLITNFSFYFIASLILVLITLIMALIFMYRKIQVSYSLRIQVFSYATFVLPLVVVTFAVLSALGTSTEREIRKEFEAKSRLFADQVSTILNTITDDSLSYADALSQQLTSLTRVAAIDATIYDTTGVMIATTQPLIFENGLISNLINPLALQRLIKNGETTVTTSEQIGNLHYNSVYASLRDPVTGKVFGMVSLPFFDSFSSFEQTKINTLSLMLTIFVVVFVLFSLLSAYAVNWLTFPLQYITKTLKSTTLQGRNAKMKWQTDDEIGMMVKEYNQMVDNLEHSKAELARSQKEAAWREMAKQVAHEIKNPLTPMKLTLQQLQMALLKDQLPKEKLTSSIESLLSQVDILNDIASSFNSFARMPAPTLQRLELISLIRKAIELYQTDKVNIQFTSASELWVMSDDQLLTRIFSNLILNGIQSVKSGINPEITINIELNGSYCIIAVKDNGEGIEEEIRDKVFIPHFSTKKSGSGLGLAIAKQGIELSGGGIWFETVRNQGTTFYLQLPLASE